MQFVTVCVGAEYNTDVDQEQVLEAAALGLQVTKEERVQIPKTNQSLLRLRIFIVD